MYMERERNLSIVSYNSGFGTGNHQFGASSSSSKVKVEDEEDTSMSLTQWLNPSKLPLCYLDLLNEEPKSPDEKAPPDFVVKKIVLPSRRDAGTAPGGGIRTLYSASESDRISSSKVKASIRVQSRTNNYEICGSSSKVKIPVGKRSSRNKSRNPSGQFYTQKLRSWKERSNNNRAFSPVYGKYRDVPSKKFNNNRNKNGSYGTEQKRKQKIEENIKALGELLPHETEDAPELILDDVIAHVKLLQLQMKELSRSRLGGEAISHPMISIEGFGHYIHHEQMKTKPLEEVIADLLANDFDAAASLLETKGLYLMPLSSVQGFP